MDNSRPTHSLGKARHELVLTNPVGQEHWVLSWLSFGVTRVNLSLKGFIDGCGLSYCKYLRGATVTGNEASPGVDVLIEQRQIL
jgi:hypothetical protein